MSVAPSPTSRTVARRAAARAAVAANLELLKKNGMTVTQFPPSEVAKLRKRLKRGGFHSVKVLYFECNLLHN